MIDPKFLRESPEVTYESQRTRGEDPALVDQLLGADAKRREVIISTDALRSERKGLGKKVGQMSKGGRPAMLEGAKELSNAMRAAEAEQKGAEAEVEHLQYLIGNIVTSAPAGDEDGFVVLEEVGEISQLDLKPKGHLDLGEPLSLIDMGRGVKISGSRLHFLIGYGATLQLAMIDLAAQKTTQDDFQLVVLPVLVHPKTIAGADSLGVYSNKIYRLQGDNLYLVGTSEVTLTDYRSNKVIDPLEGSRRYVGWPFCFCRGANSYGKDIRGILRIHQFDRLEIFSYCPSRWVGAEHQKLLNMERETLVTVEVSYRIVDVTGGDLDVSATRRFDTEAWVPTQSTYRKSASTSNCIAFQARRLKTRYRDANGKSQHCATLNGAPATMRQLAVILENHQQANGFAITPEVLRLFMVGKEVLELVK